jgi:hypothetical protein
VEIFRSRNGFSSELSAGGYKIGHRFIIDRFRDDDMTSCDNVVFPICNSGAYLKEIRLVKPRRLKHNDI